MATGCARSVVVVGTAKNVGKTTVFNALRGVARRRGDAVAVTSLGRDGEPADALDGERKPRIRLAAGTVVALGAALVPRSPALAILGHGAPTALGMMVYARAMLPTACEISGPPGARAMRATIDRLRALVVGPVLVDGALDRLAALAGGDDAVIVATGAANGGTIARVAAVAAETVARLALPGRAPAAERPQLIRLDGALDARRAETLIAQARGATVVVDDPTRVVVRGALWDALRAAVDLRCEKTLRVVACTTSPVGRAVTFAPAALLDAVAGATGLPTFDVVAGLQAGPTCAEPGRSWN